MSKDCKELSHRHTKVEYDLFLELLGFQRRFAHRFLYSSLDHDMYVVDVVIVGREYSNLIREWVTCRYESGETRGRGESVVTVNKHACTTQGMKISLLEGELLFVALDKVVPMLLEMRVSGT